MATCLRLVAQCRHGKPLQIGECASVEAVAQMVRQIAETLALSHRLHFAPSDTYPCGSDPNSKCMIRNDKDLCG